MVTRDERERRRAQAFHLDPANFANNTKLTNKRFEFAIYKDKHWRKSSIVCSARSARTARATSAPSLRMTSNISGRNPRSPPIPARSTRATTGSPAKLDQPPRRLPRLQCRQIFRGSRPTRRGASRQAHAVPAIGRAHRYRGHGPGIGVELPAQLLLDPCTDDPSEHLTWDKEGLIHAKSTPEGEPSQKGAFPYWSMRYNAKDSSRPDWRP